MTPDLPTPELPTPDQLDALAAAFDTLGKLHRQAPDSAALAAFRRLQAEWPLPGTPDAAAGMAALDRSARADETAEQITADHDRLYGDSANAIVPPYESVHRGSEGLLFDTQTIEVRAAYREFGLRAPRLNREPDDHLGLEFDFVGQLLLAALDAMDAGDADGAARALAGVRRFWREHLQPWAPDVLRRIAAAAGTQFMAGVALLSLGALESLQMPLDKCEESR